MIPTKKSLGQHFLSSPAIAGHIADAAQCTPFDTVLEIGPGEGILTQALLQRAQKVIAIEKDDRLIPLLKEKFAADLATKKLQLVHGDILEEDSTKLGLQSGTYIVVANIPYYITGQVLRHFLTGNVQPQKMVLLLQKEVAERIARSKKESLLSLSVKAYGVPTMMGVVKRGNFTPPPKVDSAILRIEHISRKNFEKVPEKLFFEILHVGFAHKRKMLFGNLASTYGAEVVKGAFEALSIPKKVRAEEVPIEKWLILSLHLPT